MPQFDTPIGVVVAAAPPADVSAFIKLCIAFLFYYGIIILERLGNVMAFTIGCVVGLVVGLLFGFVVKALKESQF